MKLGEQLLAEQLRAQAELRAAVKVRQHLVGGQAQLAADALQADSDVTMLWLVQDRMRQQLLARERSPSQVSVRPVAIRAMLT